MNMALTLLETMWVIQTFSWTGSVSTTTRPHVSATKIIDNTGFFSNPERFHTEIKLISLAICVQHISIKLC